MRVCACGIAITLHVFFFILFFILSLQLCAVDQAAEGGSRVENERPEGVCAGPGC